MAGLCILTAFGSLLETDLLRLDCFLLFLRIELCLFVFTEGGDFLLFSDLLSLITLLLMPLAEFLLLVDFFLDLDLLERSIDYVTL